MTTLGPQSTQLAPSPGVIARHPVAAYFVLTFILSWGGVLLVIRRGDFPATQEQFAALFPLAVMAMVAGPSVAGILLTALVDGKRGLREFRDRLLHWRVGVRWYVAALLTAPLLATAILFGLSLYSAEFLPGILTTDDKMSRLTIGLAAALAAGIVEEVGWTGFATPRLRRRYGVLATGLIIGTLWSAWHLLVNVWGIRGLAGTVPVSLFLGIGVVGTLLVFRVLMVWVYDRTRSLPVAIVMHVGLTTCPLILEPLTSGWNLILYGIVMAVALWIIVAAIAVTTGGLDRGGGAVTGATRPSQLPRIEGFVNPGFEPVRDAFIQNFIRRKELGGAVCVYHHGEKVVDLWGGVRNKATGEQWERDTMVVVWSATKGMSAMTLALAHSRGWLDFDERVAAYWPEFAQNGKGNITVRQLLAHQAGLYAFDERVDKSVVADLDRLAGVLARQKPAFEPGSRQSYHAITLGFHEGELIRRVDPGHRSLGQVFQEEIATPLGLEFYIRLPVWIPNSRLALLAPPSALAMLVGFPIRLTLDALNPRSNIHRALIVNPGSEVVRDPATIYARNFEVPSGGGVGTARAMALAYSVFATGGKELELRPETLAELAAPARPSAHGFFDEGLHGDVRFSLGFMKPSPDWPFGSAVSYGSPGSGGSLGFADPEAGIGYGYVTSQMGTTLTGDPRDLALRNAVYNVISAPAPQPHAGAHEELELAGR